MGTDWFTRLIDRLGGGPDAVREARSQSKHCRGRTKPPGHHRALRDARKRQKLARRAQRGKQ